MKDKKITPLLEILTSCDPFFYNCKVCGNKICGACESTSKENLHKWWCLPLLRKLFR